MQNNFLKEREILDFWRKNKIFDKLLKKNAGKKRWSFLDGPITANNPMGVHHAWGRTYKDLYQRFMAMKGYKQRFINGFDCQGLWVEVEVEKELGFKNKKDIENFGLAKFVDKCKQRVLKYAAIQTKQSILLGQWMDWDNSYYTMSDENNYAIWHFLKECFKKGYLYKGRDSVPWCPRCSTAISQHEILTEEYQEIVHQAVYFKLPIENKGFENTSFLVWTTTPWTIPANVALAVNPSFIYGIYENKKEKLILLKKLASKILAPDFKLTKEIKGNKLKGVKYKGPFDDIERIKEAGKQNSGTFHKVVESKDLVAEEEGTGIVHIAPGAGAEDFQLAKENKLSVIAVIDEGAFYLEKMGALSQKNAKQHPEIIFKYLEKHENGKYFYKIENYKHRYPICWRCKTELVWRVVDEWYIKMDYLRPFMMKIAKKIKWIPVFGLKRELDWLKNMQDWLISKKRYWGLALPIYECDCGNFEVIGSKEELRKRAVKGWDKFEGKSPHRPFIDEVKIRCSSCGKIVSRIPDVGNPWLDAGIVPFSTIKYFEDKNFWRKWFPADFICESFPGQFKNWFYSLITMSAVLENKEPFKKVLGYASVKDERGEEMHKSKGNAIWFDDAVEKMGADTMRWLYLLQNPTYNLNFGYKKAEDIKRLFFRALQNSFHFYETYAPFYLNSKTSIMMSGKKLDEWILSKLNQLIEGVDKKLNNLEPHLAAFLINEFVINDLSNCYIRLSRKRKEKEFYKTLHYVLLSLVKTCAPFIPFASEEIYQKLRKKSDFQSVHLCDWPKAGVIDNTLISQMDCVKNIIETGYSIRAEKKIKVRQPLSAASISSNNYQKNDLKWAFPLIAKELNVKQVNWAKIDELKGKLIVLDTKITPLLQKEGYVREFIRHTQDLRKKKGFHPQDRASIYYDTNDDALLDAIKHSEQFIKQQTNSEELNQRKIEEEKLRIQDKEIKIQLKNK